MAMVTRFPIVASLVGVALLSSTHGECETLPGGSWVADPSFVEEYAQKHPAAQVYELEVPGYQLPKLLSGDSNNDPQVAWNAGRQVLLKLFEQHVYGTLPPQPRSVVSRTVDSQPLGDNADSKRVEVTCVVGDDDDGKFVFEFHLYAPHNGPSPVFVMIHLRPVDSIQSADGKFEEYLPVPLLLERGYAVAVFQHADLAPDDATNFRNGLLQHVLPDGPRDADACGAIGAWAWGASRVLDALEHEPLVDSSKAAVIGHSRGGKTALWAGATDPRFSLVVSNNSGCMGAALSRRRFGETVEAITRRFGYWFCPRLGEYANRENELPVDQHQLIALVAPRSVHVASANEDLWADPRGEWLGLVNAAPAFRACGVAAIDASNQMPGLEKRLSRGKTTYHIRGGRHDVTKYDWLQYIETADRTWR